MRRCLFVITLVTLVSCNGFNNAKVERLGEPDVYHFDQSNSEMKEAIELAKNSIEEFQKALKSADSTYQYFAIKQQFGHENGTEHIWIGDIKIENGSFVGVVNNVPVYAKEIALGDTIVINIDKMSDWVYYENNAVRGGFTIRAIRNKLTEEEKAQFDYENGLFFDD